MDNNFVEPDPGPNFLQRLAAEPAGKELTLSRHYFCLKILSAFYICIYSSAFQTRFVHGSRQYEP